MKTKLFLFVVFAAWMLTGCEKNTIGDASLVEGGWDLRTVNYDKMVYADMSGNTHLKDSAYTRVYEDKEQVWLFYQNYISWWNYYEYEGEGFWSGYACDCSKTYTIEGEGTNMRIIESVISVIPGEEHTPSYTTYEVRKLTNKEMILSCTDKMYVSDTNTSVDVAVVYTFRRENSLLEFVKKYYHD